MTQTQHSPLVLAYAQSLLDVAVDQDQAEPLGEELGQVRQVIEENPQVQQFLESPGIGRDERAAVLDRAFGSVSPLLRNFLKVANHRGMSGKLRQVIDAYEDLLDERLGKVEVDVTVAVRLSPDELESVRQRIGAALKKDAVIHQYVDESIIGGMILRVEDRVIDSSVRYQLEAMRKNLLNAAPKR